MGSCFTYMPEAMDQTSIFGTNRPLPIWLQFVPGTVYKVNASDLADGGYTGINSILAIPDVVDSSENSGSPKVYFPLFRGITDTPVIGDPVLLCNFFNENFYIGPINTKNSPNFNPNTLNEEKYSSKTFIKNNNLARLQKTPKPQLDFGNSKNIPTEQMREGDGDFILEGRFGNSIRLGYRNENPNIIISNGRQFFNSEESTLDSNLTAYLENGSLHEFFGNDTPRYQFSSDKYITAERRRVRTIENLSKHVKLESESNLDGQISTNTFNYFYRYNAPQTIQISNRIISDARLDNIITAGSNIHIGAGDKLLITSENETIIESANIYLGKQAAKSKEEDGTTTAQGAEPLVLGNQIAKFLAEALTIIGKAKYVSQAGPMAVADEGGGTVPDSSMPGSLGFALQPLIDSLGAMIEGSWDQTGANNFVSRYHYIENNDEDNKPSPR